eukprot:6179461-Pleurochrysis_carterae.AAC.1
MDVEIVNIFKKILWASDDPRENACSPASGSALSFLPRFLLLVTSKSACGSETQRLKSRGESVVGGGGDEGEFDGSGGSSGGGGGGDGGDFDGRSDGSGDDSSNGGACGGGVCGYGGGGRDCDVDGNVWPLWWRWLRWLRGIGRWRPRRRWWR